MLVSGTLRGARHLTPEAALCRRSHENPCWMAACGPTRAKDPPGAPLGSDASPRPPGGPQLRVASTPPLLRRKQGAPSR